MSFLQVLDHPVDDVGADRRTAVAAADAALEVDPDRIHVFGRMDHDLAFARQIVDAGLEAVEPQRVTEIAVVGLRCAEQAQAGLTAAQTIGKLGGPLSSRAAAVRDMVLDQQAAAFQVEDPQPLLVGWQRKVDHRESPRRFQAAADRAVHRADRLAEYAAIDRRGGARQGPDQAVGAVFRGVQRHRRQAQDRQEQA